RRLPRREPQRGRRRPQAREGGAVPGQRWQGRETRCTREGRGHESRRREAGARGRLEGRRGGTMSEPAARLRAEGLTKSYVGRRVVDDVTIEVHGGEVVGLLGPNGAGKTTSFHMIVGLTRPDAGRVY